MPDALDGAAGSSHIFCSRSTALCPLAGERRVAREVPARLLCKDRVELTEVAVADNSGPAAPGVRCELVERIRRSIAAGNYLTSEKIDVTVDCIYQELLGR